MRGDLWGVHLVTFQSYIDLDITDELGSSGLDLFHS